MLPTDYMPVTMMGANERQDGAASTAHATPARLPCIEGFFCKILPDKNLLLRTIESVRNADASDKDEMLKELESLWSDTVEVFWHESKCSSPCFPKKKKRRAINPVANKHTQQ